MRCESCHGQGKKEIKAKVRCATGNATVTIGYDICEECGGSGITHCCDGMQAQPGDNQ